MGESMRIKEAQRIIYDDFYDKDRKRGVFPTFTWFIEEVGELAEAILNKNQENLKEEIADVFAWLLSIANLLNIDVEEAFIEKYVKK